MKDEKKTKKQLIDELRSARKKIIELETVAEKNGLIDEHMRFLSSAMEQTSEGVALSDMEGNLLFVNNAFASLHGYTPDELMGKHLAIFHTQDQIPLLVTALDKLYETGEFAGEILHTRRDGTVFPGLMQNTLLRDADGNPVGVIKTLRDITKRRLAEDKLKEDLVNMIVHDMKNPMTNTIMALDMLEFFDDGRMTQQQLEHAKMAKRNMFRLSAMIANLLEISKLENGGFPITRMKINTLDLANRVVERYSLLAEAEDKAIKVSIDPNTREIICDEWLLERILSNMLSNAIKHSYPKGEILLESSSASEQDCVVFSVRDFGEGIPEQYHQMIFEKFSQAQLRKLGHRSDTGLGLAFCKMAVEALGGKIWLESRTGKGSRFNCSFPGALPPKESRKALEQSCGRFP